MKFRTWNHKILPFFLVRDICFSKCFLWSLTTIAALGKNAFNKERIMWSIPFPYSHPPCANFLQIELNAQHHLIQGIQIFRNKKFAQDSSSSPLTVSILLRCCFFFAAENSKWVLSDEFFVSSSFSIVFFFGLKLISFFFF